MDDASGGRPRTFFWGNNYFIGSMSLCQSIHKLDEDTNINKKQSANVGLSFINGNTASALAHENPPFLPRFGILKLIVKEAQISPNVSTNEMINLEVMF